jgi:hypothetical protein
LGRPSYQVEKITITAPLTALDEAQRDGYHVTIDHSQVGELATQIRRLQAELAEANSLRGNNVMVEPDDYERIRES